MKAQSHKGTKRERKQKEQQEGAKLQAEPQDADYDFNVKHGDRYTKMSYVADRPQELAKFVVPLGEEVTRHWTVNSLRKMLNKALKESNITFPFGLVYETWLMTCNLDPSFRTTVAKLADFDMDEEKSMKQDMVIPKLDLGLKELEKFIVEMQTVSEEDRLKALEIFTPELKTAVKAMHVAMMKDASKRIPVEVVRSPTGLMVGRVALQLHPKYHKKLELLYRRFGSQDGEGFEPALAVLLLRYDALKGGAFQRGLPPGVMAVLKKDMGVFLEGFASPLNCYFPRYCSLFPDCEFAFGSLGSFFEFRPLDGSFSAFPPPALPVALATVHHIEDVLVSSSRALSFVLILHGKIADDSWAPLQAALTSMYFANRLVLAPKEHILTDGFAHGRDEDAQTSFFTTHLIVLQNEAGSKRWPLTDNVEKSLREAFQVQEAKPVVAVATATATAPAAKKAPSTRGASNWKSLQKKLKKK